MCNINKVIIIIRLYYIEEEVSILILFTAVYV